MKSTITLTIAAAAIIAYNFFGNEEVVAETAPAPVTEVAVKEDTLSCIYAERLYATQQDMWDDNEAAQKGDDAFERCMVEKLTADELEKAWELQKAAPKRNLKKEFLIHQEKSYLKTTLG